MNAATRPLSFHNMCINLRKTPCYRIQTIYPCRQLISRAVEVVPEGNPPSMMAG